MTKLRPPLKEAASHLLSRETDSFLDLGRGLGGLSELDRSLRDCSGHRYRHRQGVSVFLHNGTGPASLDSWGQLWIGVGWQAGCPTYLTVASNSKGKMMSW